MSLSDHRRELKEALALEGALILTAAHGQAYSAQQEVQALGPLVVAQDPHPALVSAAFSLQQMATQALSDQPNASLACFKAIQGSRSVDPALPNTLIRRRMAQSNPKQTSPIGLQGVDRAQLAALTDYSVALTAVSTGSASLPQFAALSASIAASGPDLAQLEAAKEQGLEQSRSRGAAQKRIRMEKIAIASTAAGLAASVLASPSPEGLAAAAARAGGMGSSVGAHLRSVLLRPGAALVQCGHQLSELKSTISRKRAARKGPSGPQHVGALWYEEYHAVLEEVRLEAKKKKEEDERLAEARKKTQEDTELLAQSLELGRVKLERLAEAEAFVQALEEAQAPLVSDPSLPRSSALPKSVSTS